MVSKRAEWEQFPVDSNSSEYNVSKFYRIWSSILFILCVPPASGDFNGREIAGDGVVWAGSLILHALGQEDLFLAFDINRFLCVMAEHDGRSADSFSGAAQFFTDISNEIFALVRS